MSGLYDKHSDADDAFLAQLAQPPRAAFAEALYVRLARQDVVQRAARRRRPAHLLRLAYAAAVVLALLGVGAGGAALARRTALLPHSAPLEIAPATPGGTPALPPSGRATYAPAPSGRRWEELDELARKVGLPLLTPTYLPPRCEERERFGYAPVQVAYRTYSCVTISQQAVVRGGIARDEQPQVGAGAIEDVTIDGQDAYFIHGAWLNDAQGRLVWQSGLGVTLVLERDGLLIRLREGNLGPQPEEELRRIAESLRLGH